MGVVIETQMWEPSSFSFIFLFCCCISSIILLPYFANTSGKSNSFFDLGSPFLRFQRRFLLVYSLASGQFFFFSHLLLFSIIVLDWILTIDLLFYGLLYNFLPIIAVFTVVYDLGLLVSVLLLALLQLL